MASSVFPRLCFAVFFLAAVGVFASFEHQHGDLPLFAPRVQPCVSRESLPSGTLHLAGTDHVSSRVDRSFCGGRLQPARRPPSFLVGRRSRRLLLPGSGEHRLQGESCSRDEARFFDAHRAGGRLDCLGHHSTASLGTRCNSISPPTPVIPGTPPMQGSGSSNASSDRSGWSCGFGPPARKNSEGKS